MQEGHSQPRKGLHLQCRGLLGWGVIERISLGRNIIRSVSLQGSCLGKVSWKIDHRKEGQSWGSWVIRRAWNPLGVFFQLTFWPSPLSEKAKVLDSAHKTPHVSGLWQRVPYTNSNMGKPSWKGPLSLKYHVPLPSSSPPWHPGILSSNKAFSGTLYPVVDQEKQTCVTAQQGSLGQPATLVRVSDL